MATVTASLVVTFQTAGTEDAGSQLQLIIDDREDGLNGGNTTFYPGDSVYILRFKTNDVTITAQTASDGTLNDEGSGLYQITNEIFNFSYGSREASLPKPYTSGFTYTWEGRDLGTPAIINQTKLIVPTEGVARLKVSYKSAYQAFRLYGVNLSYTGAVVGVKGTTPE